GTLYKSSAPLDLADGLPVNSLASAVWQWTRRGICTPEKPSKANGFRNGSSSRVQAERIRDMKRNLYIGSAFLALLLAMEVAQIALEKQADAQAKAAVMAPRFEVDPFWPKPLPNQWHIGQTIGVGVDAQDHVWIIHRVDSLSESEVSSEGAKAPPVLAFDQAG